MRRLLIGMVVAAATAMAPLWAMAGNQEVAEKIAASLRESGQLHGFRIGVKFQNGTAWLNGRVSSQEQLHAALDVAGDTEEVARVVNRLTVEAEEASEGPQQFPMAIGPEQLTRPIPTGFFSVPGANSASLDSQAATVQKLNLAANAAPAPRADRVATSFTAVPVQRVGATSPQLLPTKPKPRPYAMAKAQRAKPAVSQPAQANGPAPANGPAAAGAYMVPVPVAYVQPAMAGGQAMGQPIPQYMAPVGGGVAPVRYDQPHLPSYSWPSYAAYPNYAGLTYPKQYSPTAWPYIGPFYPYPQVPLGWRKVALEWHDGWWHLDFDDGGAKGGPISSLFRAPNKLRR